MMSAHEKVKMISEIPELTAIQLSNRKSALRIRTLDAAEKGQTEEAKGYLMLLKMHHEEAIRRMK